MPLSGPVSDTHLHGRAVAGSQLCVQARATTMHVVYLGLSFDVYTLQETLE